MKIANRYASGAGESRLRLAAGIVLAGLMVLTGAPALHGQGKFCFPSVSPSPIIEGVLDGDPGWSQAFSTDLGDVVVRGARDTNYLYLSVQAKNVDAPSDVASQSSVVIVTFASGGNGSFPFQQIQVFPVAPVALGHSGPIKYWWGTANKDGTVAWTAYGNDVYHAPLFLLNDNVWANSSSGSTPSWDLEMAIPFASDPDNGVVVPSTGLFKFYVDVFRVVAGSYGGAYQQASWPRNQLQGSCSQGQYVGTCHATSNTPPVAFWGNATIDPAQSCP